MTLFVDTSVWSQAFHRDQPVQTPEVTRLRRAVDEGELLVTTGLVLQEILQGFSGPRDRDLIVERFATLPFLTPDRDDHIQAAELRNTCRRNGIQIGTIDAVLAQLCLRRDLTRLTADQDFLAIAAHSPLIVWR